MVRFKTSDGSTFDCELSMEDFMRAQVSTWIEAHGTYANWREFDTVIVNPRQICYWWEVPNAEQIGSAEGLEEAQVPAAA